MTTYINVKSNAAYSISRAPMPLQLPRQKAAFALAAVCLFADFIHPAIADEQFDVQQYAVTGNRILSDSEIARLVAPYTGPKRVFGDIQKALEAIESAYRNAGYSAVQVYVPEQELTGGTVIIQVTETRLDRIVFTGNRHFDEANLRRSLPALREGTSPNARKISENVQLINENPAKQVDVVLSLGEQEGTVNAKVNVVEENPLRVYLTADNTGNTATGKTRIGLALQHANLFNRDHTGTFSYTTSVERPDRVDIYSFSYRLPLYPWGDSIDFIYGNSSVNAGASATVAGPLIFSGKGQVYGLRYNHYLPRRGEFSSRLIFGLDQRQYDNTCTIGGAAICGAGGSDATVRPLNLAYTGQWLQPGALSDFNLSLAHNLPGGPHGRQADFTASRSDAPKDYTALRLTASHLRVIARDWQVRGAFNGQYSGRPLLAGEQLGLAGSTAVRGFQERAIATDYGLVANLELYTPDFSQAIGLTESTLRTLAFIDYAQGGNHLAQPGTLERASASSAGLGLRFGIKKDVSLKFDVAHVIRDRQERQPTATASTSPDSVAGNWRGHVAASIAF